MGDKCIALSVFILTRIINLSLTENCRYILVKFQSFCFVLVRIKSVELSFVSRISVNVLVIVFSYSIVS